MMEFSGFRKWPATAIIIEPRADGSGYFIRHDKGRRVVNQDGEHFYLLKKTKEMTRPFDYDMFHGKMIILYRKTKDELIPCKIKGEDVEPIDQDMKFWLVQKYRYVKDKYTKPSFMERYGALMVTMTVFVLFILLVAIVFNFMENIGKVLIDMSSQINTATGALANAISSQGTVVTPDVPPF